jgi:hypothetical protein
MVFLTAGQFGDTNTATDHVMRRIMFVPVQKLKPAA